MKKILDRSSDTLNITPDYQVHKNRLVDLLERCINYGKLERLLFGKIDAYIRRDLLVFSQWLLTILSDTRLTVIDKMQDELILICCILLFRRKQLRHCGWSTGLWQNHFG